MVEWKEYRIKDLGEVVTGNTPPTSNREYYGTEYKFIKPTDMVEGQRFVSTTEEYYSELAYQKYKKCLLPPKTPCVVTIGSLGKKMCLTDTECFTNQAVNAVIPNKENDGEFLYYAFKASVLAYVKQLDSGTTSGRENVSKSSFSKIKVRVPPLPTQQKIASILSAYDNLIQNYKKQIEALQTAASELYKEWFVRFRFPGHENVEMENGLPKGWKRGSLSDVCEFKRGKNITSSEMQEGNVPVISAGLEPSGYHSCSNVRGVNVTMSSSGANAGYIAIHYSDIWAADCSYIEESTTGNIYYVYELLNNIRTVINNFQRGAAQPHVYPKDVNRIKLILPSKELMLKANGRLEIMHKEIYNLQKQNSLLARQRDLLLPRLMSGKLEVKEELLE